MSQSSISLSNPRLYDDSADANGKRIPRPASKPASLSNIKLDRNSSGNGEQADPDIIPQQRAGSNSRFLQSQSQKSLENVDKPVPRTNSGGLGSNSSLEKSNDNAKVSPRTAPKFPPRTSAHNSLEAINESSASDKKSPKLKIRPIADNLNRSATIPRKAPPIAPKPMGLSKPLGINSVPPSTNSSFSTSATLNRNRSISGNGYHANEVNTLGRTSRKLSIRSGNASNTTEDGPAKAAIAFVKPSAPAGGVFSTGGNSISTSFNAGGSISTSISVSKKMDDQKPEVLPKPNIAEKDDNMVLPNNLGGDSVKASGVQSTPIKFTLPASTPIKFVPSQAPSFGQDSTAKPPGTGRPIALVMPNAPKPASSVLVPSTLAPTPPSNPSGGAKSVFVPSTTASKAFTLVPSAGPKSMLVQSGSKPISLVPPGAGNPITLVPANTGTPISLVPSNSGSKSALSLSANSGSKPVLVSPASNPKPISFTKTGQSSTSLNSDDTIDMENEEDILSLPGFLQMQFTTDLKVKEDDIGVGGTAVIKKGSLLNFDLIKKHHCQEVAVKYYKKDGEDEERSFLYEVALSHYLNTCRHVVEFIGYTEKPSSMVMKCYPYNLSGLIRGKTLPMEPEVIFGLALDIAESMMDIHNKQIIHLDLKPQNILIEITPERKYLAFICDFGFANMIGSESDLDTRKAHGLQVPNKMGITAQYASPEFFSRLFFGRRTATQIDRAIDVYAFSVTLYEMVTGEKAWAKVDQEDVRNRVIQGERPPILPEHSTSFKGAKQLLDLVEQTWQQSPTDRPTFQDICVQLYQLMKSLRIRR